MTHTDTITKIIVPILAASISGILVWFVTPNWELSARDHGWVPIAEWKQAATKNGWILKEDCPANPVKLNIIGPGDNSSIKIEKGYGSDSQRRTLKTDLIVETSKAVESSELGFILNSNSSKGYRVVFPTMLHGDNGNTLRTITFNLPFAPENGEILQIWSLYVDDEKAISSTYSSFAQISKSKYVLSISEPISVQLVGR